MFFPDFLRGYIFDTPKKPIKNTKINLTIKLMTDHATEKIIHPPIPSGSTIFQERIPLRMPIIIVPIKITIDAQFLNFTSFLI